MNDLTVTGIVLKAEPIGEYDRRVVLLTKEKGKISAFARGALRPKNQLVSRTNPFVFGLFDLYVGSNSYSINKVEVKDYFDPFMKDLEITFYGTYFLEIADYYGRENADNLGLMRLLYVALQKMTEPDAAKDFIKTVFEIKAIMLEGEFPELPEDADLPAGARRALQYLYETKPEHAFSFSLTPEAFQKLKVLTDDVCRRTFDREFNSLSMIRAIAE